jgi:hypothetical protein
LEKTRDQGLGYESVSSIINGGGHYVSKAIDVGILQQAKTSEVISDLFDSGLISPFGSLVGVVSIISNTEKDVVELIDLSALLVVGVERGDLTVGNRPELA